MTPPELDAAVGRIKEEIQRCEPLYNVRCAPSDLRILLDALREARRQAFEEAAQKVKGMIDSDWTAAEPSAKNEALDFAAYLISELAAKEQS